MMKALVLEEYNKFSYKDIEDPKLADGDILIQIKACAICGSDVHGYDGRSGRRRPPVVMGHEASGVIIETGRNTTHFNKGDRVVFNSSLYCRECHYCRRGQMNLCRSGMIYGVSCEDYHLDGAMCEYIVVPEYIAFKIPDSITFEQAALIEPLSIALHAINNTPINLNDTAVVFGTGTIGLMIIKALKHTSCSKIIAVDMDEAKLEMAKANGADVCLNADEANVIDEIKKLTDHLGADFAIEAVGVNSTVSNAIGCLKKGGSLTLVGNVSTNIDLPLQAVVINELLIKGSYGCANEYETAIGLLSAGKINISDCISITAPLSEGQQCFDRLHSGEKGLLKIVLIP